MTVTGTWLEMWLEMMPDLPDPDQLMPRQPGSPRSATLTLGAVLTAPGCGRDWTRAVLREWHQPDELAETAAFLVSELVTNAVLASAGAGQQVIHLSLALERGRVLILVRDYVAREPVPRHAGATEESGRGLTLVAELSDRFGWYPPADKAPGKVVWALTGTSGLNGPHLTAPGEAMSNQTLTQHPCPAAAADRGGPPGPAGSRARAIAWPACSGLVPLLADRRVTRETGHG